MDYNFTEIEKKWQARWAAEKTFRAENTSSKPKYYVLDMFPYPSGAGLHVGHPLGYIASDIFSRYKRHKGFNVLHPMGYDSFGLPAEQYAIQTGQHPALTTEQNIARYREQMDKIGFSYDWDREVRTSDPEYYKWTQWIFIQLFNSWYNPRAKKAEDLSTLIHIFETEGFKGLSHDILTSDIEHELNGFTPAEWKTFDEKRRNDILMNFRLAYLGEAYVNWCPAMGTVLANDEVKDGVSERGGYPVERKLMKQWSMRITVYAQRLLDGLDKIDWTDSLKEAQRNWIGRSEGSSLRFSLKDREGSIEVFTTRPDTIFGVSFVTLAPEHELVDQITTAEQKKAVDEYVAFAKNRSERERQADVTKISGVFTGAYVGHPFTRKPIPVWVGDYVLAGYGTGAVMAVPAHDTRDHKFAGHFGLPRPQVIEPAAAHSFEEDAWGEKEGKLINSDFLNGLDVKAAIKKAIEEIEKLGIGKGKVNYRLRDAVFGRQRYWGEPIPIYYKNGIPHALSYEELPLRLPEVDKYLPTEDGEPPLARANNWKYKGEFDYETTTMPGWAGSSWYFLRYMDAKNDKEFVSKETADYWQNVDLYLGGSEHATGHLLYVRFWTMFLFDRGYINVEEPAKKLINQGMIQGTSCLVYRINGTQKIVSAGLKDKYETTPIHIDVNFADNNAVDIDKLKAWRDDFANAEFELESGKLICGNQVEKMGKRYHNAVNPDDMCNKFGADTLRLYEMFLGPLELSKPWNTNGITGVSGFLKKLWRLFYKDGNFVVNNEAPNKDELKTLHKTIKKITDDIERFSFNTSVSNFMICVNELTDLKCNKKEILEPLLVLISPYAPHITEELWEHLGHKESIAYASFPLFNEEHVKETSFSYPVSFNGKVRFNVEFDLSLSKEDVEKEVLTLEQTNNYLEGKAAKKVIVVPGRIINIVV
ncbi:MAG: leucyl-tRNA synthetase [Bacteroidetes bacterium]|jgi:leucyl-tRNA synthetase|nr:leucyl-tRNA synthetase [Bacteroidota bacterium]